MGEACEDAEPGTYEAIMAPAAIRAMTDIGSRSDRAKIDRVLCVLDTVPGIGHRYDPLYEAEEFLVPLGISQYRLAKAIGKPESAVSAIVNGHRAMTCVKFSDTES